MTHFFLSRRLIHGTIAAELRFIYFHMHATISNKLMLQKDALEQQCYDINLQVTAEQQTLQPHPIKPTLTKSVLQANVHAA